MHDVNIILQPSRGTRMNIIITEADYDDNHFIKYVK